MAHPICPNCHTPQVWEMWRHCHCGYDFGLPSGDVARAKRLEKPGPDDADHDGTIIVDPPSPRKVQACIRHRMVVTWLIIGTLLWLGWIFGEPLRAQWFSASAGVLAGMLPRLRSKVPRYVGTTTSVRLRVWVALVAAVLLGCYFVLPVEVQPYILTLLLVPGAIAAIYSEARLFWDPLRYLP
jgi:hypothetical protein